ncbi:orotate phosphoribosyltransferase [Devriesea agamarum]|uniref:orotate phosphoribosyltransferase n=1 Tax=Devriesea agamarum TaxID=472569 RepID=UPI00071DE7B7|nr:orotate phosphoribosyltransferase [Devriesea agamarum]
MTDARTRLLQLINDLAVVRGTVTLSSGAQADYYIDLRRITLHHEAAPLVGQVMLELFQREGLVPGAQAVGGLTLGADPVATAIVHASAGTSSALDAFVVRKSEKAHGLQRRIEGPDIAGRSVIAVEDTSTTGSSVLTACEAMTQAGAQIQAVAVIMDRGTGAREKVEAAGYRYLSAFTVDELAL